MKIENLERGNEIQRELKNLREHLYYITNMNNKPIDWLTLKVNSISLNILGIKDRVLKSDLFPIELKIVMDMYIAKVQAKIKSLETEFDSL